MLKEPDLHQDCGLLTVHAKYLLAHAQAPLWHRPESPRRGNAAGTGGWSCQQFLLYVWDGYDQWPMYKSSYTLLRGENNQGHLAEIPESSSWAVENKQLFSHALQHGFVFKRMLKSTLSQLSLHLPRVWWIFIWIHAKRGSLPLRAQKELEKNVFCLPSTQTTFYADWCTVL